MRPNHSAIGSPHVYVPSPGTRHPGYTGGHHRLWSGRHLPQSTTWRYVNVRLHNLWYLHFYAVAGLYYVMTVYWDTQQLLNLNRRHPGTCKWVQLSLAASRDPLHWDLNTGRPGWPLSWSWLSAGSVHSVFSNPATRQSDSWVEHLIWYEVKSWHTWGSWLVQRGEIYTTQSAAETAFQVLKVSLWISGSCSCSVVWKVKWLPVNGFLDNNRLNGRV